MEHPKSPFFWFILAIFLTAVLTFLAPQDESLGEKVRVVYLHEAWRLAAAGTLALAGLTGLLGILFHRLRFQRWSVALGRAGIFFWVTYLPLMLWAMQTNWQDLFTSEPRFRLVVISAAVGVLLQIGLTLIARPAVISLANLLFAGILAYAWLQTPLVSPGRPSPVLGRENLAVTLYFFGLTFLALASAYFMTRWWLAVQRD